jgi:hypothetical protein
MLVLPKYGGRKASNSENEDAFANAEASCLVIIDQISVSDIYISYFFPFNPYNINDPNSFTKFGLRGYCRWNSAWVKASMNSTK